MVRAVALGLLLVISMPLIPWARSADTQTKLPPCCRRDGKHHCSMMMEQMRNSRMARAEQSGPSLEAAPATCPLYRVGQQAPAGSPFVPAPVFTPAVAPAAAAAAIAQTEAQFRVSYSRSRNKRGPPTLLS